MLFLKYLDDLEGERAIEAELVGKRYNFIIDEKHHWSRWAAPKRSDGSFDHDNIYPTRSAAYDKLIDGGNVHVTQHSITALKEKVDIIVTDPPYFDDVQYAELSEFFYVWERKALKRFHDLGDVKCAARGPIQNADYNRRIPGLVLSDTERVRMT